MRNFELFIEILQKVEVQADTIEQAKQILEKDLEAKSRNYSTKRGKYMMQRIWLTEEEVKQIIRQREQEEKRHQVVNTTIDSTDCMYCTYDMEGDHCKRNMGEGVGNRCRLHWNSCPEFEPRKQKKVKCECCGKLVDHTTTLCSAIAAMSFAYCDDCMQKNLEPYHVLVSYFADTKWDDIFPYWQTIIKESCKLNNKTLEQFEQDCIDFMENYKHNV